WRGSCGAHKPLRISPTSHTRLCGQKSVISVPAGDPTYSTAVDAQAEGRRSPAVSRGWVRASAVCDHWDKWGGDSNCEELSAPPSSAASLPQGLAPP
ncbi:hypothetical protein Nmel_011601, partial [Mimus melanotis]